MKKAPGTIFRRLDLHMHTPASSDYKDKSATPRDIIDAAKKRKLDAIAVTDHNTIDWVEKVRTAVKGDELVVFPGFELNAVGGHVIAIFDPSTPFAVLETALIECGIPKQNWGKEAYVGHEISAALEAILKNGGLSIAAHADKPKGIFDVIQQGPARQKIYNDTSLSAMEAFSIAELQKLTRSGGKGYSRNLAIVQGSDAHSLSEIGTRNIEIRLDHISIEGLRQAFVDPEVRLRYSITPAEAAFPYIESLSVDRGFLKGETIEFNTGLNCLIGGAGTGKSTIIEFLRFVLDQISGIETVATDCYEKLKDLAGIGTAINIIISLASMEKYEIVRIFDNNSNPFTVTRLSDNRQLSLSDLRQFFPIHGFSQGEVISICRSPLAQLDLIDRHLEIKSYLAEIAKSEKILTKQSSQIVKDEASISDKSELEAELSDLKTRIELLSDELRSLKESKKNAAILSHPLWLEEEAYWQNMAEAIVSTKDSIQDAFDGMELEMLDLTVPEERTPNKALLLRSTTILSKLEMARERAKGILLTKLAEVQETIEGNKKVWSAKFSKHTTEYTKIKADKKSERLGEVSSEIGKARKRAQEIRRHLSAVASTEKHLKRSFRERDRLFKTISDSQARIRVLREKKAKEIVKQVAGRISLKYLESGNRTAYESLLTQVLKGTYAQRSIVESIASKLLPRELVKLVKAKDSIAIDKASQISQKWAGTILESLLDNPEAMYKLETVVLEDKLEISLKVAESIYKPLGKLSTGQKATVIVLLTMVEGNIPIIFDQPEDALYTPFIYSDIVKTLRNGKDKRQFILATHNPNIAIGADVDLGIILEGTANQTSIQSAGGLDDDNTRGLLLLHLEGGETALKARHVKFGIK